MTETILKDIALKYPCTYKRNAEMKPYTTFRIGGRADFLVWPESTDTLVEVCKAFDFHNIRYLIVGNGSNLLFPDNGFDGCVILCTQLNEIRVNDNIISAQCGASLIKVSCEAQRASLKGLEFAYGIPASVGGAVYMNAGAYGSEISCVLKRCRYYDRKTGEIITAENKDCDFSYRNSIFEKNGNRFIILEAEFELEKGEKSEIKALMEDYMSRRREKQPIEYPSAGSAFKRTEGYFTAKLIDEAGLKGFRVGGAQVSEKHAGFIINTGDATANDVKALMEHIKKSIKDKFDVDIEGEIRIIE